MSKDRPAGMDSLKMTRLRPNPKESFKTMKKVAGGPVQAHPGHVEGVKGINDKFGTTNKDRGGK